MKRVIALSALGLSALLFTAAIPLDNCTCKGIELHGRVRVVESRAEPT